MISGVLQVSNIHVSVYMKCIVFGATGYLGRHLISSLKDNGHEINIPQALGSTRFDLLEENLLSHFDFDVDTVFMFAGATGTATSFNQYKKFILANELILLNVLDAIRRSPFRPRVVFPSTRLVYQGTKFSLPEDGPKGFKTPYSVNKIACEHYLHVYSAAFDIPFTVLRISVPYGNQLDGDYSYGTVGSFINQARSSGIIRLYGGGDVRRTFSHIDDLCRIITLASFSSTTINKTFNMPGEDLSLRESASLIAEKFSATVQDIDWPDFDYRIESGNTVFDSTLIEQALSENIRHKFIDWVGAISVQDKLPRK